MRAYRLAKNKYINDLSGVGARFVGGRWNEKGSAALYAATSRSLALAEFLVHVPIGIIPEDIMLAVLEIPDDSPIVRIRMADLPNTWTDHPPPFELAKIGSNWLRKNSELVLCVPSAVVAEEWNLLINPNHPDMCRIRVTGIEEFCLDRRLFRKATHA